MKSKTLLFSTAKKRFGPTLFSTMVKPIGSVCNLQCNYCYYLDKKLNYDSPAKMMSIELLEEYVVQYIAASDADTVTFCWHGGEPLLTGIDFFKYAIELQKKYSNGKKIENTLQTNGVLIDDAWADFFAENNFLLGVSIDGPKAIHDANRMTVNGTDTFEKVVDSINCLKQREVQFNTLSAVSSVSAGKGREVYRFLKSIGSQYMQFLPVVEHVKTVQGYSRPIICAPNDDHGSVANWSIQSRDWGYFLCDIFDVWVKEDVGKYFVQMFDATLANWCGTKSGICSMNDSCGDAMVVEHNGDVYSCDHFVYSNYKLGNIIESDLKTMFKSQAQFRFAAAKSSDLVEKCQKCAWLKLCYGECPKHRFDKKENYLCTGLQHFFRHSANAMEFMKECLEKQLPPALIVGAKI